MSDEDDKETARIAYGCPCYCADMKATHKDGRPCRVCRIETALKAARAEVSPHAAAAVALAKAVDVLLDLPDVDISFHPRSIGQADQVHAALAAWREVSK